MIPILLSNRNNITLALEPVWCSTRGYWLSRRHSWLGGRRQVPHQTMPSLLCVIQLTNSASLPSLSLCCFTTPAFLIILTAQYLIKCISFRSCSWFNDNVNPYMLVLHNLLSNSKCLNFLIPWECKKLFGVHSMPI